MSKVKTAAKETLHSITHFGEDSVASLGHLLPVLTMIVSLASMIVGYILFVGQGGYGNQLDQLKTSGLSGVAGGFTTGSAPMLVTGFLPVIIGLLFAAQMVLMIVAYFKDGGSAKKVLMIIDIALLGFVFASFFVFMLAGVGSLSLSKETIETGLKELESGGINAHAILVTYLVIAAVAFLIFCFLIAISKCKWMLGYGAVSLVFHYAVLPVFTLLLENIIPLLVTILLLVIIALVIFIVVKVIGKSRSKAKQSAVEMTNKEHDEE